MLNSGLLEEMLAPAELGDFGWRQEENGTWIALRITSAGLHAIGVEPEPTVMPVQASGPAQDGAGQHEAVTAGQEAPVAASVSAQRRTTLRGAATALLGAWDAGLERPALPASIEALRAALMGYRGKDRLSRDPSVPRRPREGTKQQAVLALLRRAEGTTVAQVMDATGWAQHTVRGFLAGLKKKGHTVEVLERVRQVGPGAQGAKGSYSVYRIASAAAGEQG
jgi:hypothetical protein